MDVCVLCVFIGGGLGWPRKLCVCVYIYGNENGVKKKKNIRYIVYKGTSEAASMIYPGLERLMVTLTLTLARSCSDSLTPSSLGTLNIFQTSSFPGPSPSVYTSVSTFYQTPPVSIFFIFSVSNCHSFIALYICICVCVYIYVSL